MDVYRGLRDCGIGLVTSVPCVNLGELLRLIASDARIEHLAVTREEEGIGICAGAYLGGMRAAILMQNSGLGNSINALASLDLLYGIPLLMVISHRGVENEPVCAQVPMGELTAPLLEAMGIRVFIPGPEGARETVNRAWQEAERARRPVAVLLTPSQWR